MSGRTEIVADMSESEYHALKAPEFCSGSSLKPLLDGIPAACITPWDGSESADFGTIGHLMLLEPHRFGAGLSHYLIPETYPPDGKKWTRAAGYCKDWHKDHADKTCLKLTGELSHETLVAMRKSVMDCPVARRILELPGEPEVSMFAECPLTGLQLKCRSDKMAKDDGGNWLIADVKCNADPFKFERQNRDRAYHIQCEMNTRIAQLNKRQVSFLFVVIGTKAPYPVRVINPDRESRAAGLEDVNRLLPFFAACKKASFWPSYRVTPDLRPIGENGIEEVRLWTRRES